MRKELTFWQKYSLNCDFYGRSTFSVPTIRWRVGPVWRVRWARIGWEKFSIVFAPYSID
jgi:hypothetical protein